MAAIDLDSFERFVERVTARRRARPPPPPPPKTVLYPYDVVFRDVHESGLPEEVAAYVAEGDDGGSPVVVAVLELAPGRSVSLVIDMTVEGFPFSPPAITVDECDVEEDLAAATRVAATLTSPKFWSPALRPAAVLLMLLVDIRLDVGISV